MITPEIKDGEETQKVKDMFDTFDYDDEKILCKEYIESLNTITTFYDYTFAFAEKDGYTDGKEDVDALSKYIFGRCKEKNIPLIMPTIKNWLKKSPPASNQEGRKNVYKLCFALGMNATQTKEFFLKAYLERPFNYKDIFEATCFFCINNGLTYSDSERISNILEDDSQAENGECEVITENIGKDISLIKTEDDFIKYIKNNRSEFVMQNQTATAKINDLIEACKKSAVKETSIPDEDDVTVKSIDDLLNIIYGFSARATAHGEKKIKSGISKSRFPELIKKNFSQRQQFEQIDKGNASFDVIRKALIMLTFYSYFVEAALKNEQDYSRYCFDDFVTETNLLLSECGYVQLYWRNPYDWMFGFCANAFDRGDEPLEQFRLLIEEFYLKDPEINEADTE